MILAKGSWMMKANFHIIANFQFVDVALFAFDDVSDLILTCQMAAIVEVINPIVGIVENGNIGPFYPGNTVIA